MIPVDPEEEEESGQTLDALIAAGAPEEVEAEDKESTLAQAPDPNQVVADLERSLAQLKQLVATLNK